MLAAPYLLFAGLCGLAYRAVRRARQERDNQQPESHQPGVDRTNDPPSDGP